MKLTVETIEASLKRVQAPLESHKQWLNAVTVLLQSAIRDGWTKEHEKQAIRLVGRQKP